MFRPIAILFTILLALYLLVHYAVGDPKPAAPKPAQLPPLMTVGASTALPAFSPMNPPTRFDSSSGILGGLPQTSTPSAATPALETRLYAALRKVARYRQFVKTTPHPAYLLESQNERHFVVSIGEDANTQFVQKYTLRIWKSGRVDQLQTQDGSWVALTSR